MLRLEKFSKFAASPNPLAQPTNPTPYTAPEVVVVQFKFETMTVELSSVAMNGEFSLPVPDVFSVIVMLFALIVWQVSLVMKPPTKLDSYLTDPFRTMLYTVIQFEGAPV